MKMSTLFAMMVIPAAVTHAANGAAAAGRKGVLATSSSLSRSSASSRRGFTTIRRRQNWHQCRYYCSVGFAVLPNSLSRCFASSSSNSNDRGRRRRDAQTQQSPRRLPWTPICENECFTGSQSTTTTLRMMKMNLDPNSEGSTSEPISNAAAASEDIHVGEVVNHHSLPALSNDTQQKQQQHQHLYQQRNAPSSPQPSTNNQGGGFGFPKLTPGRQRNYKSQMISATSALQQSFRRKNVVSSLERLSLEQQQQQLNMNQRPNGDTTSSSSTTTPTITTKSPPATTMERNNIINGNYHIVTTTAASPTTTISVEPSKSENFRNDPQRFKVSGSDGMGMVVMEEVPSSLETPNNEALASSSLKEHLIQQQQQPTSSSTTTSTTVSTTYTTTTTSGSTADINNNNNNDPFRGKSSQYFEKLGPQSMNFRDGSRMNMYKDKAFRVAVADADRFEEDDDEDEEEELGGGVYVNGGSGQLIEDEDMEEEDSVIRNENVLANNSVDEMRSVAEGTAATKNNNTIPSSGTTELSLDPKNIEFLPAEDAKEEEDLLVVGDEEGAEPYMSNLLKARLHDVLEDTETGTFVKMFRGSASYIASHRGTIAVYHIPGELLTWEGFPGLMDDIALTWLLGMKIVLVAGCRHQIDLRLEEDEDDDVDRGYSGKVMMSSIRVTDEDTLRVVKEEAGFVRFEIERRLAKSLRLHGGLVKGSESLVGNVVSGNFYSAQPFGVIDGIDYCWTGFPRKVEVERIRQVHETHDIVLLTSLGVSPSGEIFNVNSEFLAATVAGAVSASKIVYFNVHGTSFQNKNTNKPVQNLRVSDAKNLLTHYNMKIHPKGFALVDLDGNSPQQQVLRTPGSMETLIKVGYSMVALEKGVKRAHILAPENGALVQELYTRDGCGTLISRDIYEGIRRADVNDVSGIYDLIDPLVRAGTLVPRPKSQLEKEIKGYYVYTRDGLIVATGQLKRFEGGFAEIGCLVVSKDYRKGGRGDAMLGYLERLSLQSGARKVFVLSTQTMDWFLERGFREVSVESLPPSRQAMYNRKRKSKIYMKEIDGERDLDAAELWWSNQVSP